MGGRTIYAPVPMPDSELPTATPSRLDTPLLIVSWVVLLALFGLTVWAQNSPDSAARTGPGVGLRIAELQAKYLVGAAQVASDGIDSTGAGGQLAEAAEMIDAGSVAQRLRYIVLAGELGGPSEMLDAAANLHSGAGAPGGSLSDDERMVLEALERVAATTAERYHGASSAATAPPSSEPIASPADAALLRTHLGWFGELALAPPLVAGTPQRDAVLAPAKRLVVAFIGLLAIVGIAALGGVVGLAILAVVWLGGMETLRFRTGAPRATVYAETFVIWFLIFTILAAVIMRIGLLDAIAASMVAMIGSLAALAWPVVRGIPFGQVRRDIGLHAGAGVVREVLAGIAAYAMSLPLLGFGILLMFVLMAISRRLGPTDADVVPFAPSDAPSHPLIDLIADNGTAGVVAAALLASVVAPIVEETMFRGVLYRHLREATRRWGTILSVVAAALVTGFIFAAIHPQGWVTIPALMALACGFTVAREWRDSLIPGIVAHGLNNGLIVAVLVVAFAWK